LGTLAGVTYAQSQDKRGAATVLRDVAGDVVGAVTFTQQGGHVLVHGQVSGLPEGFHGFHIHAIGQCTENFLSAAGHLNPTGGGHPTHHGDMPVLLVNADGSGETRFQTDRFLVQALFDQDGSAVIVHADPDNYANIPTRYAPQADATTLATGDAGGRIACGVIE
jgi:Cu-Zn family superoxide dismutase